MSDENENGQLGLKGKGAEAVKIEAIDKLAKIYVRERDARIAQTSREVDAKTKLIDELRKHKDQLGHPDGALIYRYDETTVSLIPRDEKLKVEIEAEE